MTLKHLLAPSVMAISLSLAACNNAGTDAVKEVTTKTAAKVEAVATQPVLGSFGIATENMDAPVGGWVDVDVKDVDNYIFYLTQSGLGMPNRDYYLDEGEKSDELRAAYVKYLRAMLTAAGDDNPLGSARKIMAFETAMARSHWTNTKRRNHAPGFPWDSMLEASGISDQKTFVVRENDAIKGLAKTFGSTYGRFFASKN